MPASSEAPIDSLQSLALPVILLTVGDFDSLKTTVTTASYASLAPLRISQFFSASSTTARIVLERKRFSLSIAALEQLELVKSIAHASPASVAPKFDKAELVQFAGGGKQFYFGSSLFAFDCEVEDSFDASGYVGVVSLVRSSEKGNGAKPLIRFGHGYGSVDGTIFSDDIYPI